MSGTTVMGLDISTKTGISVLKIDSDVPDSSNRLKCKLIESGTIEFNSQNQPKNPSLPDDYHMINVADWLAHKMWLQIIKHAPDYIYIEQTNKGRNRFSQKQLEFIHYSLLKILNRDYQFKVTYCDTSEWRAGVGAHLSKDDKKNNQMLNKFKKNNLPKPKKTGKKTPKHVAVRMVNELFSMSLKIKDNNEAEAILISLYGAKKRLRPACSTIDCFMLYR